MKRPSGISVIWLIFGILFAVLGGVHWKQSGKSISRFEVSARPMDSRVRIRMSGAPVDQPLKDFVRDFNLYIDDQNKNVCTQNRLTAFGYFFAAATALFSVLLAWRQHL